MPRRYTEPHGEPQVWARRQKEREENQGQESLLGISEGMASQDLAKHLGLASLNNSLAVWYVAPG